MSDLTIMGERPFDPLVCDGAHDWVFEDERDGIAFHECASCGARAWEEVEDGGAS
jgi:hypothetical protein